jgi:hypothetical protein
LYSLPARPSGRSCPGCWPERSRTRRGTGGAAREAQTFQAGVAPADPDPLILRYCPEAFSYDNEAGIQTYADTGPYRADDPAVLAHPDMFLARPTVMVKGRHQLSRSTVDVVGEDELAAEDAFKASHLIAFAAPRPYFLRREHGDLSERT